MIGTRREEAEKRDLALDALERYRGRLIDAARVAARRIALANGSVTSIEVFEALASAGWDLTSVDPRWMGAVFRKGSGWRRIGWEAAGSHGRPVARWELRDARGTR